MEGKPGGSLHKLSDDTPETADCAKKNPEIVNRLKTLRDDWIKEVTPK